MPAPDSQAFTTLREELEGETKSTWTLEPHEDSMRLVCRKNERIRAWFPYDSPIEMLLRAIALAGTAFNQGIYAGAEQKQREIMRTIDQSYATIKDVADNELSFDDPTYFYQGVTAG